MSNTERIPVNVEKVTKGWTTKIRFPAGPGISLFDTTFRTALRHTQPLLQWVSVALSPGIKQLEREAGIIV
jgi:hypothetical protein